jgi:hypothetical protein
MDCLVMEDFVILKSEQGDASFVDDVAWQEEFQLD